MLDPQYRSFTCEWNIPYVYGLTPGELAYMIERSPGWIKKKPSLTIVPMAGWYRSMYWEDTGLMWIPTSPHIPTAETALNYVATGFLGEAGGINTAFMIGYFLTAPFFGYLGDRMPRKWLISPISSTRCGCPACCLSPSPSSRFTGCSRTRSSTARRSTIRIAIR